MNDNAKEWISALRSGKYQQGIGYLRHGDNFCCLGVACELYREANTDLLVTYNEENFYAYNDIQEVLPGVVSEWLGVQDSTGRYHIQNGFPDSLANHNDFGASFAVIADIIESEPRGLFA